MTTVSQILNQITSGMSVDNIRAIVNAWDMSVGNGTLLLFSGGVGDVTGTNPITGMPIRQFGAEDIAKSLSNGTTLVTIESTGIQNLFEDLTFRSKLSDAIASDPVYQGRSVNQVLFGLDQYGNRIADGFWDDASRNLVEQHSGNFQLIMPDAPDNGIGIQTEISALLEKAIVSGQQVNGISLQDWQAQYDFNKTLAIAGGLSETQADQLVRLEINDLVRKTSTAMLADVVVGKDANGILYLDTNNTYLGEALGLTSQTLPVGVEGTRLSVLDDMRMTASDMALIGKYGDLLNKAGIVGDVLGTAIAVGQATAAYNAGDHNGAGEILAGYAGNLGGGFAVGTGAAALMAGLLLTPGVNVPVLVGMVLVGSFGLAGGYAGGSAGQALFEDLYNDISSLGIAPYFENLIEDYNWAVSNSEAVLEEFLAGFKTNTQLKTELNLQNIEALLNIEENEWINDRVINLVNGLKLYNFHAGDEIFFPTDPVQPVFKLGIDVALSDGIFNGMAYSFYDINGNLIEAPWIENNKVYSINNSSVEWTKNTDGTYTQKSAALVENSRETAIDRYDEAHDNGQVVSSSSSTINHGDGTYTRIDNTTTVSTNSHIFFVKQEIQSDSSGVAVAGGKVTTTIKEFGPDGTTLISTTITSAFVDAFGYEHLVVEFQEGADGNWRVQEGIRDENGELHQGNIFIVPDSNFLDALQFLGGTAGSLLGSHLAEGNVYKNIVYSAFLGAIGEHFGTLAAYLATPGNGLINGLKVALGEAVQGSTIMDDPSFSSTFYGLLSTKTSAALAGVIIDEVGDALGLDGVAGEIFDVVGSTVTTGIIKDTFDLVFDGLDGGLYTQLLQSGFDFDQIVGHASDGSPITIGDQIQIQLINAVASFAGERLAGQVVEPQSEIAAIFGSVGSTIGGSIGLGVAAGQSLSTAISMAFSTSAATANAALAGAVAGPLGIAIGAFLGSIAGTVLGNIFGGGEDHPSSFTFVDFNPDTKLYQLGGTFTNDGGPAQLSANMAEAVMQGVNDIIAATGGTVRHTSIAPELDIGWKEGTFFVNVRDGAYHEFGSAGDAISFAALHTLKNFDLVGGHAVVMRAWHNSEAATIQEWKEDIEVAEAFQLYLTNPTGILAMMLDQPDSALAQSWAKILKRAGELELHLPHEKDLDGGWNELLLARGDIDPGLIPNIEGDSIVMTDPVTGQQTVLHHVIGPGYEIVRITGTDGNDIIQVIVDGPSITYVDAGAGDDFIEGSDERDIILGGSGDDTINGNAGDDWINGGLGEDTVHGNGGLDLIYGGDDNDQLFGDEDADAIYGGKGDDNLEGLSGNDELFGGHGNDTLNGNSGFDILKGEQGDDVLQTSDNDKLYGGLGNDTYYLNGSAGQANIARGEGHDVIYGNSTYVSYIRLDYNISPNELWFESVGDDLLIKVIGEDQSILVKDIFDTSSPSKFVIYSGEQLKISAPSGVHDSSTYLWKEAHLNAQHVALGTWVGPSGQYNSLTEANIISKYNTYQSWISQGTLASWMLNSFNVIETRGWENVHPEDDKYFGTVGDDSYALTSGIDISGDIVYGGAGNDTVTVMHSYSYSTHDIVYGDSGDDNIDGGYGNDTLIGGLGSDTLSGFAGADAIYGGAGNDIINGGDSADLIYGGTGDDSINGDGHNDNIYGGIGNDYLIDNHGNNLIYGEDGDDSIIIYGAGNNLLDGGAGNDLITGYTGNDRLYGGAGNDTLDSGGGDDFVYGDSGDDTLTYILSSNLMAQDVYDGGAGSDKIIINLTTAQFAQDNIQRDLLRLRERISAQGATAAFTFMAFALSVTNVEAMEAKVDGVLNSIAYSLIDGTASIDTLNGTSLHNRIRGMDGSDVINGGSGHDYLDGGAGDDIINGDDGFDDIRGGAGNDTLSGGNGDDDIEGDEGDDSIFGNDGHDVLSGGNGTDTVSGGSGDDTLSGGIGNDVLAGGDGNDKLFGESGDDIISGNSGNDILEGGSGDDTLEGGAGADLLAGGIGNDEYRYDVSGGHDTISDISGSVDVIRLGVGITQVSVSLVVLATNDLKITFSSQPNDSITLLKQAATASSALTVEKLIFSDDSEINLNAVLTLSVADDQVSAIEDQAKIINVLINDNALSGDTLTITAVSDALYGAVVANSNGTITYIPDLDYSGNDSFTYTATDIFGHTGTGTVSVVVEEAGPTIINGTTGADTLNGTEGDDIISGLGDNDTVNALGGDDILVYNAGVDILNGGSGVDIADFSGFNWAVWVDLDYGTNLEAWTVDKVSVYGGEANNVWRSIANLNDIENLKGSDFHDRLIGNTVDNILIGLSGNDLLYGEGGNDTMIYNSGFDTFDGGDGIDLADFSQFVSAVWVDLDYGTNYEAWTTDKNNVYGGQPDDVWRAISDLNNTENVIGSNFHDKIWGNSGNNLIMGKMGDDILYGEAGNDILYGGFGVDSLTGGAGADTFVFESASAFSNIDSIQDFNLSQADKLDLSDLLSEYDPLNELITDFIQITTSGSNSIVSVDVDGGANSFVQIATIVNVTGLTDEAALKANGTLVV